MNKMKAVRLITYLFMMAASSGFASSAFAASIVHFQVALTGFQETDGNGNFDLGDPDGFGVADLRIDTDTLTIDWEISTANLSAVEEIHIHNAAAGSNGGIVLNFNGQLSGTGLFDADLEAIVDNPTDYYVNVHTCEFVDGAIRGQLSIPLPNPGDASPVPVPAAFWLFGSGLLGMVGIARRRTHS